MHTRLIGYITTGLAAAMLAVLMALALWGEQLLGRELSNALYEGGAHAHLVTAGFGLVVLLLAISWHLSGFRLGQFSDSADDDLDASLETVADDIRPAMLRNW